MKDKSFLKNSAMIVLQSKQWSEGEDLPPIKLTTVGSFGYSKGQDEWQIEYEESEATGMEGTLTQIILEREGTIRMKRQGSVNMDVHFITGENHLSQINTPQGTLSINVMCNHAMGDINPQGGNIHLSYTIDFNQQETINTRIDLAVKKIKKHKN